jgi:hypothetical protein
MLDIRKARKAADEHHKWFMEEATSEQRRAFLDSTCPPEPGDYYGEPRKKRILKKAKK